LKTLDKSNFVKHSAPVNFNHDPHDPSEDAIGGDLRDELYAEQETESAYREAAKRCLSITLGTVIWVRKAKTVQETMMRLDLACWLFGDPALSDLSLTKIGKKHKKHRATASNAMTELTSSLDLPPALAQKALEARANYHKSREAVLTT